MVMFMKLTIKHCNSLKDRFLGMMFQVKKTQIGYYFKKCHSIHTFFCFFPIDVVLLDKENNILDVKYNLKPFRIFFFSCYSIVEFYHGYLDQEKIDSIRNFL